MGVGFLELSLVVFVSLFTVQSHLFGASMHLLRLMLVGVWLGLLWVSFHFFDHYIQSSVQFSLLRSMLVGVWLGLLWASFHFFDHCIQSSVQFSSVQFSSVLVVIYLPSVLVVCVGVFSFLVEMVG